VLFSRSTIFKNLACLLIGLLASVSSLAQQPAQEKTASLVVTVTDSNWRFVKGLGRERFGVFEKKTPLELTAAGNDERPLSVAVLLDLSSSQASRNRDAANWVAHFIKVANAANEYLLVGFYDSSRILCDWNCSEKDRLEALSGTPVPRKAQTALYDAVDSALKQLESRANARRIVVILSDGQDNVSKVTFSQLRRSLERSDVMLYAIGLFDSSTIAASVVNAEGKGILDELATVTGGRAFFPPKGELTGLAEDIAMELRHQYLLTFKVTASQDREVHKIKVTVTPAVVKPTQKPLRLQLRYKEHLYAR